MAVTTSASAARMVGCSPAKRKTPRSAARSTRPWSRLPASSFRLQSLFETRQGLVDVLARDVEMGDGAEDALGHWVDQQLSLPHELDETSRVGHPEDDDVGFRRGCD